MNHERETFKVPIFAKLIKIHEIRENLVPQGIVFYKIDIFKEYLKKGQVIEGHVSGK